MSDVKKKSVAVTQSKSKLLDQSTVTAELIDPEKSDVKKGCDTNLESTSDDDMELIKDFNEQTALYHLFQILPSTKIVLSVEAQKNIGLEIGANVSTQLPWKQVQKEVLEQYMPESTPELKELKSKISHMERGDLLLVGYAQVHSEVEDTFLVFDDDNTVKTASEIIKSLEAFHRRKVKTAFEKFPKSWKTKGSEFEVDNLVEKQDERMLNVEIQSIYPMKLSASRFRQRKVSQVRDGYVELLPGRIKFENIVRKRIDLTIQSAPPRVHLEQQTDPTFPTNAWSQYLYEIKQDILTSTGVDSPTVEEERPKKSKKDMSTEPEIITVSDQIKELLDSLEFNQIDMYRNDYPHIAKKGITRSEIPILQESYCFADLSSTANRFLTSMDWHPTLSGISVASYTFRTLCSTTVGDSKLDIVQQTVLEPNPILMWSFDNVLTPKLEFKSQREVMALSFCPYDENLLIGGFINGQVIIWDLKDKIKKAEIEEVLTPDQIAHKLAMKTHISWTKQINRDLLVLPTAISSLENSQKRSVTSIQWMSRKLIINNEGQIKQNVNGDSRFFITSAMDGTIFFWDLDGGAVVAESTKKAQKRGKKLPEGFLSEESSFKYLDQIFRPTFTLSCSFPISCFMMSSVVYNSEPINIPENRKLFTRVGHKLTESQDQEPFECSILISSYLGEISKITWDGCDGSQGVEHEEYATIHDGPVLVIKRCPFYNDLFLTIGRHIVSVWKNNFKESPILWRKRKSVVTNCIWSENRPSVFFVTREDGNFEVWDLLARTDGPCIIEALSGHTLTCLAQHKLSLPREAIGIGDHNSNLRLVLLPKELVNPLKNELELLKEFVEHEIHRKNEFVKWKAKWIKQNGEFLKARREAEEAAKLDLERLEKEFKEKEELELRRANEDERRRLLRESRKVVFDLPEKLEKKWDEMNYRRLMKVLMSRKLVDKELLAKQTKPLKDLMRYAEKKKESIKHSFAQVHEEIAIVRAKLLPPTIDDTDRREILNETVVSLMDDHEDYSKIEENMLTFIEENQIESTLEYKVILERARQRRDVINQSVGGNIQHRITYNSLRSENKLNPEYLEEFETQLSIE